MMFRKNKTKRGGQSYGEKEMAVTGGRTRKRRGGQMEEETYEEEDYEEPSSDESSSSSPLVMGGRSRRRRGGQSYEDKVAMGGRRRRRRGGQSYEDKVAMGGRRRRRRGGQSAASYGDKTLGSGETQWNNVFNNQQTMNAPTGNGLWSSDLTHNVGNTHSDPSLGKLLQGGRKKRKQSKKGGSFGSIIGQALVPFGLLGLQQSYSRKRRTGGRSRRHVKKIVI